LVERGEGPAGLSMDDNSQPLVCIVVLHWRNYERTVGALRSLRNVTYRNYRVIVVDNFSNDGSVEKLEQQFPDCEFLRNESNLGFARGCNRGIHAARSAGADYVLLLNNDMEVEADFLDAAIGAAEKQDRVGLITGKILFGDRRNVIWQAGGRIDLFRIQGEPRGWNETDQGQYEKEEETFWASGAMLLIPRHTIETVGLLPEEYFFGVEEWDYSTLVIKAELKILYVPTFKGYHYAGGSYHAGDPILIVYNGMRNKLVFAQKYFSTPAWLLWKIVFKYYLAFAWPRKARWGCATEADYHARLKAAHLAYDDHRGVTPIELSDLQRAAQVIGPTPTWGATWLPTNSKPAL
jgi:GT2 family glycosyltransferase